MRTIDLAGTGRRAQAPPYRFHGRTKPAERRPLAAVPEPKTNGRVVTIRLYGPIDSWGGDFGVSAAEFAEVLDGLPNGVEEIRLHLNSPGGDVWEGVAVHNALVSHPAKVVTVVEGLAASIASVVALAGDEVLTAPTSNWMVHSAWAATIGDADDLRETADLLDKVSDQLAALYARRAGGTAARWRALMKAETWFDADEAVAAGLAHRLAEAPRIAASVADLSMYRHAGRSAAPAPAAEVFRQARRHLAHRDTAATLDAARLRLVAANPHLTRRKA